MPFGDDAALKVGQPVLAIGNPLGLAGTVTSGIQTSAAINPGNSGGARVDMLGRLVGVNSSIATLGARGQSGSIGIGFAIPAGTARWTSQELIENGRARHSYLGARLVDAVAVESGVGRRAARVMSVVESSPATDAGLRADDQVVAIDGEPVDSSLALIAQIRSRQVGTTVTLKVIRGDGTQDLTVTLAERPANRSTPAHPPPDRPAVRRRSTLFSAFS